MATSNGKNNGNGNVEPGSQSASGQEHLPPRRPSHSAHASGSSTKAATASSSDKKGPKKKRFRWAKRIGFGILTVFLGFFIIGMAVFLYLYNTLSVPAPADPPPAATPDLAACAGVTALLGCVSWLDGLLTAGDRGPVPPAPPARRTPPATTR